MCISVDGGNPDIGTAGGKIKELDGLRFSYELSKDSANYDKNALNHRVKIDCDLFNI